MATWAEWIRFHTTAYGHTTEADIAMVTLWAEAFGADGWTPDELVEATRWILTHVALEWRGNAVAALLERLRAVRAEIVGKGEFGPTDFPDCRLCSSTGWVSVPDPVALKAGRWGTCLACCTCALGRWKLNHGDPRPNLDLWYQHMPDWREQMEAHDRGNAAALKAMRLAEANDRSLGQLQPREQDASAAFQCLLEGEL